MAYVAISRAKYDAVIYTESASNLGVSLDRSTNKESALEATQQQLPFNDRTEQGPTHQEPAPTRVAELTTEIPIAIARERYEHNPINTFNRATSNGNGHEVTLDGDHEAKKDRNKLSQDSIASQQQRPSDHNLNQAPTHPDPAPTKAAELEIEAPEIDLGLIL